MQEKPLLNSFKRRNVFCFDPTNSVKVIPFHTRTTSQGTKTLEAHVEKLQKMFANPTVFVPEGVVERVWSDVDVRS